MKKMGLSALLFASVLAIGACGSGESNGDTSKLEATISSLEKTVDSLKKENQKLTGDTSNSSEETLEESSSEKENAAGNLLAKDPQFSKIASNNGADEAKIVDRKDYGVSWSDDSWSGLKLSADKVSVIKVDDYDDYSSNKYQGFIIVHFIIDNTERDVSVYPEQATVNTNTGQQVDGSYELESFAGDIMKGTKTQGFAAYPLKELGKAEDITSIRLNFNGSYETDDYDDENANHTFDVTLELK